MNTALSRTFSFLLLLGSAAACAPIEPDDFEDDPELSLSRQELSMINRDIVADPCEWAARPRSSLCKVWPGSFNGPACTIGADGEPTDFAYTLLPTWEGLSFLFGRHYKLYGEWDAMPDPPRPSPVPPPIPVPPSAHNPKLSCMANPPAGLDVPPAWNVFSMYGQTRNFVLFRMPGVYDHIEPGTVRGTLEYFDGAGQNGDHIGHAGAIKLVLQRQDGDRWIDVASASSPRAIAMDTDDPPRTLNVSGTVQPNTNVRLEVRVGNTYHGEPEWYRFASVRLSAPICVPDPEGGGCL
jgi:hypothetical protein